jgi:hypothetical protein
MRKLVAWRKETPAPIRIAGMPTPAYAQVAESERRQAIENAPDNVEARKGKRERRRER